jgi:hypothetical protein
VVDIIWYNEAIHKRVNGRSEKHEESLLQKFPHGPEHLLEKPLVILNVASCIIIWYLPDAISLWIQVSSYIITDRPCLSPVKQTEMADATIGMGSLLKNSMTSGLDTWWRTFPGNFHNSDSHELMPGCINLAPCWFQQDQEVSIALP